ncbi:MAG TPA: PASTA domain-containing protein [Bacteroidota bacterium]|nr:PASTA domain-containing protein [Bacteroidota bacterium]
MKKLREFIPALKRIAIAFGILIVLFFIVDDIVMPRYVQQGETTKVPNVVGLNVDQAMQVLADAGLTGKEAEVRPDKQFPEGTVAVQTPLPDSEVKFGRGVYLTVSGGERLTAVPGLRGKSVRDATLTLERFGLKMGIITYQVSTEYPENTVIEQSVVDGTNLRPGTLISVIASQGPSANRVPVPNLVRKPLAEAERILLQAGLKPGNITFQVNNSLLPNTVIDQYPRAGGFAAIGQGIELFVSQKADQKTNLEN